MSWEEQSLREYLITTGDGKQYRPLWRNANKALEYNVAEYNFPGVSGTFVKRNLPKGRKFAIEIYFTGSDNLDQSAAFEKSANDRRPWKVDHPYYGLIQVQPISLNFDDSSLNATKITGTLLETIGGSYPKTTTAPANKITTDVAAVQTTLADTYATDTVPTAADVNQMNQNTAQAYASGEGLVTGTAAENYFNALNTAQGRIANATAEPLAAIRSIQTVISAPAQFQASVQSRIGLLRENLTTLQANLVGITKNAKNLFQAQGGTIISSMALAASQPTSTDYANRTQVLGIVEQLLAAHASYLESLGTLQSINGGQPTSFIPSGSAITALGNLINFTVNNLFDIASNTKQERSFILEYDSNWLLLAHRLYGISPESNIKRLMDENRVELRETLHVRKGRVILYYI